MVLDPAPKGTALGAGVASPATLRGRRLLLARAAWLALVVPILALYVVSVPAVHELYSTVCVEGCPEWRLSPEGVGILREIGMPLEFYAAVSVATSVLTALVFFAVAAVIYHRKSNEPMALFLSFFLVALGADTSNMWALAEVRPALWVPFTLVTYLAWACFVPLFYLFPDGRFVPRWTRWLVPVWVLLQAAYFFLSPPADSPWLPFLGAFLFFGFIGSMLGAQVYRYIRVSGPAERQQTKWVVFGVAATLLIVFGSLSAAVSYSAGHGELANVFVGPFYALIPLSIGFAILRHRLFDIDVIINRTLVYGALTACVVGIYVLIVGYLGALLRTGGNLAISLIATGVVAVLFQPLRYRLQRFVNRLMYGERDDPYAVISRLGERLEATLERGAVLPTVARTVREALKLPYAAVALGEGKESTIAAEAGSPVDAPLRLPLAYRGETVGELLLGTRVGEENFSPADRRLLDDLTRQVGVAVHAVRLTDDLQRSRERLVTTREEERRRLRRDLHDGLGPTLGSLPLKLDVAGDLMEKDPAAARALLDGLKAQAKSAVADIRRLVYELRPPALDDLGLLGAVRETAAQHGTNGLRVSVEAPEDDSLPPLPAAVEVAAYRIVGEALTNVASHAAANECVVRLTLDEAIGALRLEIEDDGRGISPRPGRQGVGLHSMRERAEELGGECVVESPPGGGTRVYASLPRAAREQES